MLQTRHRGYQRNQSFFDSSDSVKDIAQCHSLWMISKEKKIVPAPQHKIARLNFAKEQEKKPVEFWKHILWLDETKINVCCSDGIQHI